MGSVENRPPNPPRTSSEAGWHAHHLRVRYGETDQMGVVYHANYLVFMEEGRTRLMESLGASYAEVEAGGYGLVVRRADLRYRAPARYDQRLLIRTRLGRLRGASVSFEYEVRDDASGTLLAEGSTELACVRLDTPDRGPCLLPADLRERLLAGGATASRGES